jgi:hypothetical protein
LKSNDLRSDRSSHCAEKWDDPAKFTFFKAIYLTHFTHLFNQPLPVPLNRPVLSDGALIGPAKTAQQTAHIPFPIRARLLPWTTASNVIR